LSGLASPGRISLLEKVKVRLLTFDLPALWPSLALSLATAIPVLAATMLNKKNKALIDNKLVNL
jgi:hypothetical protein